MKIKLNIDTREWKQKPKFVGGIRNRLCNAASIREVTPELLIECIQRGRSFTPAVMTGTTGDTWQQQQVICADIDNNTGKKDAAGNKIMIDKPMTPARALEVMAKHGITPYFMYHSFSHTDSWPKFRIVLVLDEPITDPNTANDLIDRFTGIFNAAAKNSADTTASDNARLYYGGKPDSVFYVSGQTTDTALLHALPVYEAERPAEKRTERTESANTSQTYNNAPARDKSEYRAYSVLQAQFEADKKNFDLADYVERTTSSRPVKHGRSLFFNPCPICGHNDDFQVTGCVYHCWGGSEKGGSGGTIIDYLINKDGLDKGAACDKFKYEIMGYDRDEWRQAYIDEKYPKTTDSAEGAFDWNDSIGEAGDVDASPTEEDAAEQSKDTTAYYIRNIMPADIASIKAQSDRRTGFANLDAEAGAIYAGLYAIGGISSVGKTTFISQIADQMAALGQHVLFFSMEQSKLEMITKSISRQTAAISPTKAVTSLQIRTGEQSEAITNATDMYLNSVGDRISILEGNFNCTVKRIRKYTETYIELNDGIKPVVIIDYLQILQPEKDPETGRKMTDIRQIVDHNVTELKLMSRSLEIPIFVVSSVNRSNYLTPIDFEAFKESGGIEYTADVVWGLQLAAVHNDIFDKEGKIKEKRELIAKAKEDTPREIELVCLKNRYGKSRYSALFTYYPQYDYFVPKSKSLDWNSSIK